MRSQLVQVHYIPDILQDTVQGIYVLMVDVTDLKKAEHGLRAANHELEAFTYAVAHDLRAPLRALSGFSNALLEDYGDSLANAKDSPSRSTGPVNAWQSC
jgi:light-regulated signal transduction histidine kinase (bacteriophytochrome)